MSFNNGRAACRHAKQPWWTMLWAAAGMQMSRPGTCWQQERAGSCSPAMQKWQFIAAGSGHLQPCTHAPWLVAGLHACPQPSMSAVNWW